MAELRRRGCCLSAFNNVFSRDSHGNFGRGEMNPVTLATVFLCGVVCAGLLGVLRAWWLDGQERQEVISSSLGVLPAGADLTFMDEGYVAMALLGDHGDHQLTTRKQTTELEDQHAQIEALNTLRAAKELVYSGKSARAGRLLEHALSLAPRHPDVLVHYGEFLEHHHHDVIKADKLYLRALAVSPANSHALRNRRRTQPLVDEMDVALLARIDNKRDDLARIPSSSAALRRIKKEAYYQHIYHTAGIEGNTMTLAQTRMILETRLSVGGKSVMEHNEIIGLDSALKFINTTLLHRVGRVTLHDILEVHRRVLGHVDPLEAGRLRTTQVYVSDHIPPPPTRLQMLMEDFVVWLNSPEAQALHPVRYAALAHYKLVFIHPFSDGNGRTARLIMNFLLMQAGYPPVIIRKQDRMLYYDCLQLANEGDTRPFVRFVAHCTEKTLDVYLWATKEILPKLEQRKEQREQQDEAGLEKPSSSAEKVYLPEDGGEGFSNSPKERDGKFVFTSVDDISPWEGQEEREVGGGRVPAPTTTTTNEDHILTGDGEEEEEEAEVVEVDGREQLWFVGEEERVRVRGTGKESRIGSGGSSFFSSSSSSSSSDSGRISSSSSSSSSSREHDKVIRYLIAEERLAAFVEERSEGESVRGL